MSDKYIHEIKYIYKDIKTLLILIIILISLALICLGSYNIINSIGSFNNNI